MAITYKLNDCQVSFHWDKECGHWTAKSEDLDGLNLKAKNFNSILKMLNNQHPELATSIQIFFPGSFKAAA